MPVIAILGAGTLGGALARTLSLRGLASEIRLLDDSTDVAAGKALDIRQAGPLERFDTRVVASRPPAGLAGADAVLLAAPVADDAEWDGEEGLDALQQLDQTNRRALIVCAGAGHRQLVEQGVAALGIDRQRLIGSAPEALRAAVRAIVALEAGCPASEVSLTVLGAPPDRAVVPWSQATAGGVSLDGVLPPAALVRLRARVAALWPPGPFRARRGSDADRPHGACRRRLSSRMLRRPGCGTARTGPRPRHAGRPGGIGRRPDNRIAAQPAGAQGDAGGAGPTDSGFAGRVNRGAIRTLPRTTRRRRRQPRRVRARRRRVAKATSRRDPPGRRRGSVRSPPGGS